MGPAAILMGFTVASFTAGVVLLVIAFRARANNDSWGVGAGILAALSGAFLSAYFSYQQKNDDDRLAAVSLLDKYALTNLLIREQAIENYEEWANSKKYNVVEFLIVIPPEDILSELAKSPFENVMDV
jgi:hypothetical protein